ncbi:MAG TPA: hypothetical protein VFV49_10460 [Thermoanaerobaculia bacterium]|nr:hypothetical protein [Thermoanaerobaculia bacterium]
MVRSLCRVALLALCVSAWCVDAAPARVLFPANLHLTRQVQDPLSGKTVIIDEYCSGNRVVSISGDKTVIADYDKQQLTEINRREGTYSISRFDEVATVTAGESPDTSTSKAIGSEGVKRDRWTATPRGMRGAAGRSVEHFEFAENGEAKRKVEVGIDRSVVLSEEAVEVLIGAAYPNPRREEHEPLLRAAGIRDASRIATDSASDTPGDAAYGLPVTQAFTYSDSGSEVTFRTTITRIGTEGPPAELMIIPPAATRVESTAAAVRRQLRELDQPATSTPQQ